VYRGEAAGVGVVSRETSISTLSTVAGRAAEFVNYIGRNVVVASKSGPVETVPTVPVATALFMVIHVQQ